MSPGGLPCLARPQVDELRGRRIEFHGVPDVDTSTISFKDTTREAQRQARLVREFDSAERERAERDARREKAFAEQAKAASGEAPVTKRKRQHTGVQARMFEDWEQLAREERVSKALQSFTLLVCFDSLTFHRRPAA